MAPHRRPRRQRPALEPLSFRNCRSTCTSCAPTRRSASCSSCCCGHRRSFASCSLPDMICSWSYTVCAWKESSPNCAQRISVSRSMRHARCCRRPASRSPTPRRPFFPARTQFGTAGRIAHVRRGRHRCLADRGPELAHRARSDAAVRTRRSTGGAAGAPHSQISARDRANHARSRDAASTPPKQNAPTSSRQ
jgi:hypothetical protein